MGAVAQCPIEVGPNFCASLCFRRGKSPLPAKRQCTAKSGSLVRDDFRELVSSAFIGRQRRDPFGGRPNNKRATNHPVPATGRRLALRDISVADPAGNDVHADQPWNLEVIAGFGFCAVRATHPYRAHGTVTPYR